MVDNNTFPILSCSVPAYQARRKRKIFILKTPKLALTNFAEHQAQQPAHAGRGVAPRRTIIRVAGLLQRLVRRYLALFNQEPTTSRNSPTEQADPRRTA